MDWNSLIGRRRPLEIDALRLSTLVHQLGRAPSADESAGGLVRCLDGEPLLQTLDHLLRYPSTLAYVLTDQFAHRPELAEQRGLVTRRIRQLLANEREQHLPARKRRAWQTRADGSGSPAWHHFVPPRWQRLDDVLAFLTSRSLMRVAARSGDRAFLSFGLTASAAELLERDLYPKDRNSMLHLQLCGVISDLLPELDGEQWQALLADIEADLEAFRAEEQVTAEQDLLAALFQQTFQERL